MNFRISSKNCIFTPRYLFSHWYSILYFIPTRLMEIISQLINKIMNIEKNKEFKTGIHRCQELPQWSRDDGLAGRLESGPPPGSGVTFAPERGLALQSMASWCSRLCSACTGLFITGSGSDTAFLLSPHPAMSAPA